MKYDGTINIATGQSAKSKIWKNKEISWSDLVRKLSKEYKTNETYKEYLASNKQEQLNIKDVGGYVGGYLLNGRRKPQNVVHRQLLTLDIDFATLILWEDFTFLFSNAAILHGTHKHSEETPRYRLVMPLSRECSPDEYVAVARKIAGIIGIEIFDNTTFETNRLMFWQSVSKDVDYFFRSQDGTWVDVDETLNSYIDWTDSSLWATSDKTFQEVKSNVKKQIDPRTKTGLIGSFCRTYSITEGINEFLSEEYTETTDGRFTYSKGTAAAGLIVYDDLFAFSHHGTDPSSNKLCNIFDLIRLHKFGHLDTQDDFQSTRSKSFQAMEKFCRDQKAVKKTIASERISDARYDFAEEFEEPEIEPEDIEWMEDLEVDSKGKYLSSATNINLIFANDKHLKKCFKSNTFDNKKYIFRSLPWRTISEPEPIKDVDYSGVRNYIESIYNITGNLKIEDALKLELEKRAFHPVRDYLNSLEWDGEKRVDSLLIEYFGTEDNVYNREAIRKTLAACVGRIFVPGIKFDTVLVLVGDQGTGKSTFIKKLGRQWFSDTFMTVHGKEALEQIQGFWLIEMAELAGLRKAEADATKHFISKQEDSFRGAYLRTSETHKRQCVFFGSTNNKDFLKDPTGNRRYFPIDVNSENRTKSVFKDLNDSDIDQIWAEAVQIFKAGEKLYLSKEAEAKAIIEQRSHSDTDQRLGLVENYLSTKLPENWDELDLLARRMYLEGSSDLEAVKEREFVCVFEIWCECLGRAKEDMDRYKSRDLNDILRSLEDWEQANSTKNFPVYGKQKYYKRKPLNI